MSYQHVFKSLTRPQKFSEILANEPTVNILKAILQNRTVPPALLFSGIRGVGKTTLARIFARALNCDNPVGIEPCGRCVSCLNPTSNNMMVDIVEIDGASNGNIDSIRELIQMTHMQPAHSERKIIIIDEAHNLGRSQASWDALLKVLEEPPPHLTWIFCTTQKHRIPDVIKSRLIMFDLQPVPTVVMKAKMLSLLEEFDIGDRERVAEALAQQARGSIRDGLMLFEKLRIYCEQVGWGQDKVDEILIPIGREQLCGLVEAINAGSFAEFWYYFDQANSSGIDIQVWIEQALLSPLHDLVRQHFGFANPTRCYEQMGIDPVGSRTLINFLRGLLAELPNFYAQPDKRLSLQLMSLQLSGLSLLEA